MAGPSLPESITAGVTTGHATDHQKIHDLLNEFDTTDQASVKGDLLVFDGTTIKRLPIGTDAHALLADSAETLGVKWGQVAATGGSGWQDWTPVVKAGANQPAQTVTYAKYLRVGAVAFYTFQISIEGSAPSGILSITGMPPDLQAGAHYSIIEQGIGNALYHDTGTAYRSLELYPQSATEWRFHDNNPNFTQATANGDNVRGYGMVLVDESDTTGIGGAAGASQELIEEIVLGSDAANVEFTSIPSTYDALRLVVLGRSTRTSFAQDALRVQVGNGSVDTGANYDSIAFSDQASNNEPGDTSGQAGQFVITAADAAASRFGAVEIFIPEYTNTGMHKIANASGGHYGSTTHYRASMSTFVWGSTSVIDVIRLFAENGNLVAGSIFKLYGISDSPVSAAGVWQDYTPSLTATTTDPTVGDGLLKGRYARNGKTVHAQISFQFGSTSSAGSGVWEISLPVPAADNGIDTSGIGPPVGSVLLFDAGTRQLIGVAGVLASSGSKIWLYVTDSAGAVAALAHNSPFTWASGDGFLVNLTYEAA